MSNMSRSNQGRDMPRNCKGNPIAKIQNLFRLSFTHGDHDTSNPYTMVVQTDQPTSSYAYPLSSHVVISQPVQTPTIISHATLINLAY